MMFEPTHPDFLKLVRCPVTHGRLQSLPDTVRLEINGKIQAGEVFNRIGQKVEWELEAVLINQDHSLFIPIRDGIVSLIADELIPADQVDVDLASGSRNDE